MNAAAFSTILMLVVVELVISEYYNEERYKKGKQGQNEALGPIPPRFWQGETSAEVSKGRKNLFIYLNAYSPDRDGFCERIARQTAKLVKTNQYPKFHGKRRGRSTYEDVPEIFMGGSYPTVEYVDYENFPQEFGTFQEVSEVTPEDIKGRAGSILEINAEDKRPKCQPIGAQIDCRCGVSASRPAGGWCALWKCEGIKFEANPIGHWSCASWC